MVLKPSSAMISRASSATKHHEVHHVLGLAGEFFAQLGVLGGDAHRAGVHVADPHHDAAFGHQGGGGEAVLFGAQKAGDRHVAAGLHLAVGLHRDAVPQAVFHQNLVGLGQAQFPGNARVLDGGQGRGAGSAVIAADEHVVRVGLGHPRRHRAHAHLGHQLDRDAGVLVGVLEVVDELGQVLDGIDVMVRRGRDELDKGGGKARLGDPGIDLAARQVGRPRRAWRPAPS